jgi:hypothetical protein
MRGPHWIMVPGCKIGVTSRRAHLFTGGDGSVTISRTTAALLLRSLRRFRAPINRDWFCLDESSRVRRER